MLIFNPTLNLDIERGKLILFTLHCQRMISLIHFLFKDFDETIRMTQTIKMKLCWLLFLGNSPEFEKIDILSSGSLSCKLVQN